MIECILTEYKIGIKPNYERCIGAKTLVVEATSAKLENGFLVLYSGDSILHMLPLEWIEGMTSIDVDESREPWRLESDFYETVF